MTSGGQSPLDSFMFSVGSNFWQCGNHRPLLGHFNSKDVGFAVNVSVLKHSLFLKHFQGFIVLVFKQYRVLRQHPRGFFRQIIVKVLNTFFCVAFDPPSSKSLKIKTILSKREKTNIKTNSLDSCPKQQPKFRTRCGLLMRLHPRKEPKILQLQCSCWLVVNLQFLEQWGPERL